MGKVYNICIVKTIRIAVSTVMGGTWELIWLVFAL